MFSIMLQEEKKNVATPKHSRNIVIYIYIDRYIYKYL